MTILMASSYFETKLMWKIVENFYIRLEIEEDLSGAKKLNTISATNRAIRTSRNFYRFQTCQVNCKGTIMIMTREQKTATEVFRNSSDFISKFETIYTDVISIQPDETWNR
jgi:hypothetical protein